MMGVDLSTKINVQTDFRYLVSNLMRYLLVPVNRQLDISSYETYKLMKNSNILEHIEMANRIYQNEMYRRMGGLDIGFRIITL